eukprot:CAMPEP_0202968388 /NCGR_PEP_ID=MMETSP1396-20130829/13653_1 /ASSEMBLY_ACC=CAM_ASM_000872 /TAXON_ID= /ORGANISM="Pseudokeronopsis sp., Strain Brazil" /LENGTH=224 /DNA_ID=CAMNT_0049694631 /DNA_START=324 /DNA_END=997 /DNA_ORIENTATION=-
MAPQMLKAPPYQQGKNAEYEISLYSQNPIPGTGYLQVTVPSSLSPTSSSSIVCLVGCEIKKPEEQVSFNDTTLTFTVVNAFNGIYQAAYSELKFKITGLKNPNSFSYNYLTISVFDDQYNSFPITQEQIGVAPAGTISVSVFKKKSLSSKKYLLDFTIDRDFEPTDLLILTFSGGLQVRDELCSIKAKGKVAFVCLRNVPSQAIYIQQDLFSGTPQTMKAGTLF